MGIRINLTGMKNVRSRKRPLPERTVDTGDKIGYTDDGMNVKSHNQTHSPSGTSPADVHSTEGFSFEYRVCWKRDGQRAKTKIYQLEARIEEIERRLDFLDPPGLGPKCEHCNKCPCQCQRYGGTKHHDRPANTPLNGPWSPTKNMTNMCGHDYP